MDNAAAEGRWYRVRGCNLRAADDANPARIQYDLVPSDATPLATTDERGRRATEAFCALPMAAIDAESRSKGQPAPASAELLRFVGRFGPVGVRWETHRPVATVVDGELRPSDRHVELWAANVSAQEWALESRSPAGLSDDIPSIAWAWRALWRVVDLAEAVATNDPLASKAAWGATWADPEQAGVMSARWDSALRGRRPPGNELLPWRHPTRFDWVQLARLRLAEELSTGIRHVRPTITAMVLEGLRQGWQVHSLVEAMYLQILDQVTRRPEAGIGRCDVCSGPVLRNRRPTRLRANRWHRGCRAVGAKRRQRTRH